MGFNTVAMVLNDVAHVVAESPYTLTWAFTHPPHDREDVQTSWRRQTISVAKEHSERPISFGHDVIVLPTFHADDHRFLLAGHNALTQLKVHKINTAKNLITLELPAWWGANRR